MVCLRIDDRDSALTVTDLNFSYGGVDSACHLRGEASFRATLEFERLQPCNGSRGNIRKVKVSYYNVDKNLV